MSEKGPYEYIGSVYELNEIAREMGDDDLTDALDTVIKIISKPDIPPKAATAAVVKLQAYAVAFKMKAKYYMLINKEGEAAKKKNIYLSMAEALKDLVDSLKYLAKNY
jgi:hypothetical protein